MNIFFRFLLLIIALSALTYFSLEAIVNKYEISSFLGISQISLFHFSLSVCVISVIYTIHSFLKKYTAFAFLGTALIRMIAIIIFIFPLIKNTEKTPISDALFVVIPYFIFTIVEAIFTIKLIKPKAEK
ncbi:hypothetical protein CGC48_04340 [Capnocytophaga cynodegmi]|uniref:Uncharacterized protein n=1 Tax=Capnocytophaga cynodegmi TaxID=28189 RepID=A0A250E4X8_9FLAO|nr:hypothetical protein [Capnocytophaga cynodegmi]ATA67929.1 hypothetical protein CGC48_04340 [Capnocytophaga cynodegmi]